MTPLTGARRLAAAPLAVALLLGATLLGTPAGATSLNVNFTVASVAFGSVTEGTSADGQAVVTNDSGVTIYFDSANVHGGDAGDFSESATACDGSLAAGATCAIDVTFNPTALGDRAASLGVTFGAKDVSGDVTDLATIQASLNGVGTAPGFTLSDADAGTVEVGDVGVATSVLTNTSDVDLTVHGWSLQGVVRDDFSVALSTCPAAPSPLQPGQSCDIVVRFAPVAAGAVGATLTAAMDVVGANPARQLTVQATVSGTGSSSTGVPPVASLSSLDVGTVTIGTSASGQVALLNTSSGDIAVSKFALAGASKAQFAVGSSTCAGPIAPTQGCTVNVTFTPASAHKVHATLGAVVTYSVGGKSHTERVVASVSGKGAKPEISLVAPDFGTVALGSSEDDQVIVTNDSLTALTYLGASVAGPHVPSWTVSSTTCLGLLAPSASCEVDLTFSPHTTGDLSSVLDVVFGIVGGKHVVRVPGQVSLSASSVEPTFSVVVPVLGPTTKATAVTAEAVVTNTSTSTLSYSSAHVSGGQPGDFSVTGNTCTAPLAPADSCDITISFDPHQAGSGTRTTNLRTVMTIDGLSPSQNVNLIVALSGQES